MAIATNSGVKNSSDLNWLTALRIFAALWVVVHHFGIGLSQLWQWNFFSVAALLERGGMGVGFFFVLSGFILSFAYGQKASYSRWNFYVNRFARIYPVYVVALFIGLPALLSDIELHVTHHGTIAGLVLSALKGSMVLGLLQAWYPSAALFWNGVSWSLSAEAFFYALFPLVLPYLKARRTSVLVGIIFLCLGVQVCTSYAGSMGMKALWSFFPLFRVPDFIMGICLQNILFRHRCLQAWMAIPSVVAFVLIQMTSLPGDHWGLVQTALSYVCIALIIGSLSTAQSSNQPGGIMRLFVLLGNASYAVYLLQFPVMHFWRLVFTEWNVASCVGYLLTLILLSIAAYRWIEHPSREFLRTKLSTRPTWLGGK